MAKFNRVDNVHCAPWLVIPTVYQDALSYEEQLNKFCYSLNQIIGNVNQLPDYIKDLISEYINSGEINDIIRETLSQYILNVKYPPEGIKGAVGDGTADDTEAIQGCIDYANKNGGMAVYFPSGKYLTDSLTVKNNVSLFGFDRYTTKVVLKGGATKALINSIDGNFSVSGMTLDGNAGNQVNDVNVLNLICRDVLLADLILEDGFKLLMWNGTGGYLQIDNVVCGNTVNKCFEISGNSKVTMNAVEFTQLSSVGGDYVIDVDSNHGYYEFSSVAVCNTCLMCSGSDNTFRFRVEFAKSPFIDNGERNNFDVLGVADYNKLTGSRSLSIGGNDTLNIAGESNTRVSGGRTMYVEGANTFNAGNLTENIVNEKHVIAGSVTEDITGNKHVNATNIVETVQGDKTITAGDISETAVNKTVHITKDNTEQIDGNRTLTVAGDITETGTNRTEDYTNTHTENAENKILNTENLEINSTLPIKYKKPVTNGDLVTIPMRDTDGNEYNVLCEGTKLASSTFSPYLFVGHDEETTKLIIGYTTDFSTFIPMAQFDDIIARDPQIIYLNGTYYICCTYYATDYSYDTVIYTTSNFVSWTRHNINLGISNGPTWAPELAYNNGILYIFYAHTDNKNYTGMKIYRSTCTNINNLSFENGVLVKGIPGDKIDPSIFYNPEYGYTVLIAKNEISKNNNMYDYDFETNTCSNERLLNIPPHVEAVSCYPVGRYVAIIADRYLAVGETKYGTQNILSTITSDLKNTSLTLKMTNCFYNPNKEKVSKLRHVSCLKITEDMEQVLISHIGNLIPIAVNRNNPYPEHVNIEDYGSQSGNTVTITDFIPYPNTVYCIFNNPTGVVTPTTTVNLNSIINYFNLFDLYIYIGSNVNKTLTISTREGVTTINLTAADTDRFIHLRQGIDTKWSVVKGF